MEAGRGFVAWPGTQHNPDVLRGVNGVPKHEWPRSPCARRCAESDTPPASGSHAARFPFPAWRRTASALSPDASERVRTDLPRPGARAIHNQPAANSRLVGARRRPLAVRSLRLPTPGRRKKNQCRDVAPPRWPLWSNAADRRIVLLSKTALVRDPLTLEAPAPVPPGDPGRA